MIMRETNNGVSDISFLVGLKNNLIYSQKFYLHFRNSFPYEELVFVSLGSSDGTDNWLESLDDPHTIFYYHPEPQSLSDTYNKAISLASKNHICFLHNDMLLGKYFVQELQSALQYAELIYYKTIEPPIFSDDNRAWKEIRNFGSDFDDFQYDKFYAFEEENQQAGLVSAENASFFLATTKKALTNINGLDPLFRPMFCEDDDLILRLRLNSVKPLICPSALAYHFVSRTSRFSNEYKDITQRIEENSVRNFFRKWGFGNHSQYKNKRTYGLILQNASLEAVRLLEPFVSHIYSDFDASVYVRNEQCNTSIKLAEKFCKLSEVVVDDVILRFDAKNISAKNMEVFRNLNDIIITKRNKRNSMMKFLTAVPTRFKIRDILFNVRRENLLEKQLIIRNNSW